MGNTYDTAAEPIGTTSVKAFFNNVSNLDDLLLGPAQYYPGLKGRQSSELEGHRAAVQVGDHGHHYILKAAL